MSFIYKGTLNVANKKEYTPVPNGWYEAEIVSAVEKTSKNGNPMVVLDYKVRSGDYAGRQIKYHNLVIFEPGSGGSWRTEKYLHALGEDPFKDLEINPSSWIGRVLNIFVGLQEYDGKKRNIVTDYKPFEFKEDDNSGDESSIPGVPF